jgi:hypothetical protein
MRRVVLAGFCAILAFGAGERPLRAQRRAPDGSVCIARESTLPIDEAGGLAPVPMPRGRYSVRIDAGAEIPIRPDRGTLVRALDPRRFHVITLFRHHRRVAATTFKAALGKPLCFGLSNYSDGLARRALSRCACPR